ncbi:MAG: hypothetical protein F6K42_06115 [Leptolyngbya sp. SIO1D8]|nr:hypothetical protein [Leptolyngbya sp. SIO1D8]
MALSSWFRYILKRLSYLKRPVPMVSTIAVVILGIFIWEYHDHPEWFGAYSQEGTGSNEEIDLSGFTPEEQAAIADLDSLTLLLDDLGVTQEAPLNLQSIPEIEGDSQDLLLQDLLALSQPVEGQQLAGNSNPFNQYLSQYQFIGRPSQPNAQNGGTPSSPVGFGLSSQEQAASGAPRVNVLEQALQAQSAAGLGSSSTPAEESDNPTASPSDNRFSSQPTENGESTFPANETNSQAVNVPGVPFPVLPTTPQMSPPAGTTGYTPPASLQLTQPTPGGTTATGVPSTAGTSNLNPSNLGVPNIPSATGNLNLNTPQVDVSNGATTPSGLPSAVTPPEVFNTDTSPFSVDRPIGGGYINTFSNPSTLPD